MSERKPMCDSTLNSRLVGFDGHGDRAAGDREGESRFVSRLDAGEVGHGGDDALFSGGPARSVAVALVRVLGFRVDSVVGNDILERLLHVTTIAAVIPCACGCGCVWCGV